MKKVVVVGYDHYGYPNSIASGFRHIGCEAELFSHPVVIVSKLKRINPIRRWILEQRIKRINADLVAKCESWGAEIVLVINGEAILRETIKKIKELAKVAVWIVDSLDHPTVAKDRLDEYDHAFVFEPADVASLRKASYLPYGADTSAYRKLNLDFDYDLSFVGRGHGDRLPRLDALAAFCEAKNINFAVFGPFRRFARRFKRRSAMQDFPALGRAIKLNGKLKPQQINEIYNRSRINVNMHHHQSKQGLNPRTFEILASGSLLLTDWKPQLNHFFEVGEELAAYKNEDELFRLVTTLLGDERKQARLRAAGYAKVLQSHTFADRCKEIVARIEW